jgi:hypothetical protein
MSRTNLQYLSFAFYAHAHDHFQSKVQSLSEVYTPQEDDSSHFFTFRSERAGMTNGQQFDRSRLSVVTSLKLAEKTLQQPFASGAWTQ